jgi:hypothetical protein
MQHTSRAAKELLQARLASAKETAMAKARKSHRPPKSTKPTAADSEMKDSKENFDPQATLTATTDEKKDSSCCMND